MTDRRSPSGPSPPQHDSPEVEAVEPHVNLVVAGKYRLERPLSTGGMGSVWVATHLTLESQVAIKFIRQDVGTESLLNRFSREAKAAAQIRSSNVVTTLDYGVDGDLPYIVMELLEGEDLLSRLKGGERLSLPEASMILQAVARGLQRVHDAGLVHRDLKPRNIFLSREGDHEVPKLVDFGIAKMVAQQAGNATNTMEGMLLGSPYYMSPEQARASSDIDHRSDLWSLSVVAFRMITGQKLFKSGPVSDVIVRVCIDPLPDPSSIVSELSPAVDAFFRKALDRDPEGRFQSAREFAQALEELLPALSRPSIPSAPDVSGPWAGASGGYPALSDASGRSGPPSRSGDAATVVMPETHRRDSGPPSDTLGTMRRGALSLSAMRRPESRRKVMVLALVAGCVLLAGGFWLGGVYRSKPSVSAAEPVASELKPASSPDTAEVASQATSPDTAAAASHATSPDGASQQPQSEPKSIASASASASASPPAAVAPRRRATPTPKSERNESTAAPLFPERPARSDTKPRELGY